MGLCHSTCRPETGRGRAIFIAPTELRDFDILPVIGGWVVLDEFDGEFVGEAGDDA